MLIGFYSNYKGYNQNKMFYDPSSVIGDNLMYPFFYLGKKLEALGHKAKTIDTEYIKNFDAIVFIDYPDLKNQYFNYIIRNNFKNAYLIALESPIVQPNNYNKERHGYFKKVFTCDDSAIDNPSLPVRLETNGVGASKKYFKINYSHNIPNEFNFELHKKSKLCAMISSNQSMAHPKELYSERVEAIRWFENNHPEDFDLYGKGWDRHNFWGNIFGIRLSRLNRLTFLTKLLKPAYSSYKGSVSSKRETYQKYKFSVCYENAKDFPGYITEKIFDCFFAGCVPIYWGANNIADHIPKDTFIDKRNFHTYEQLYAYINNMPDTEYMHYLEAMKNFLGSEKAYPFSAEYFANTLIKEIIS